MQYMRAQIERAGTPGPRAIGVDEIAIRKSLPLRRRGAITIASWSATWFASGRSGSAATTARRPAWCSSTTGWDPEKSSKIRLIVMDMWKPFRNVARDKAPQAAILFDKFHIMRHLGEALDKVRKAEYARLRGKDRRFIKGQKYTLLSHRDNLTLDGKRSLALLLAANKLLNTAYVLKEVFGQLWGYRREGWARRFFDNWRASLRWQRLKPYERFADTIDRHWDGIAAYCRPQNKVSLGFVEGLNNKKGVPATCLRAEGRGIPPPQGPLMHASGAMTPQNHPLDLLKTQKTIRADDIAVRLGGDEFAIVQVGIGQPGLATTLATRLIGILSRPFDLGVQRVIVGASVGVAYSRTVEADADTLLTRADMALYHAKAHGRGTYQFFDPIMNAQAQNRHTLETGLRNALTNTELELFFQPILNARTQELSRFEALIRWRHPQRGLIHPAKFVPLAEEIGLIAPIGEWVLQQACHMAAGWPSNIAVAVNLSPNQFKIPNLVNTVNRALQASGLPPRRLELEITETVLLHNTAAVLETLRHLHDLGVRISLDDFGTGYSSISYLKTFPFDSIKIDQSFVRDLDGGTNSLAIVNAIANLGHALGMSVTAEGVETVEQLRMLRAEWCTEVQGYLFSAPVPAAEVPTLIARLGSAMSVAA